MTDINSALFPKINFYEDVIPARTDPEAESRLVERLHIASFPDFHFDQVKDYVHNMVHVNNWYTVTESPAAIQHINPLDHEQTK